MAVCIVAALGSSTTTLSAADGTWNTTTSGALWTLDTNWVANVIADGSGSTANFSQVDITADTTVNLNANRTIGNLIFGDTVVGSAGSWTLASGAGTNVLTLAGAAPTITVNALGSGKIVTISAALSGTSGLTKAGVGTLVLSGSNSGLTGGITITDGSLQANNASAINGTGTITIGNTAGKNSRLILAATNPTINNAITIGSGAGLAGSAALLGAGNSSTSVVTGDITITADATAGGHFAANSGNVLALQGNITYTGGTVVQRLGTVVYSGSGSSYSILNLNSSNGTVSRARLGATNGLATNASVDLGGAAGTATFDLAGFNQSLVGLIQSGGTSANAVIANSSTVSDSTLTLTGPTARSYAGVIQDVTGSGTRKLAVVVSGANQTLTGVNTYTGGTTINSGTLTLGHATDTLSNTGAVTVAGGTLALGANSDTVGAVTVSGGNITSSTGVLTGSSYDLQSGSVSARLGGAGVAATKSTGGTVTLSGSNTYDGGTAINAGTLVIGNAAALGASGTISFGGGTLQYSGITTDLSSRFSTAAGQAYNINTGGQNVTLATGLTSSGGTLTKSGTGALTLTGGTANTFSGTISVNGGWLSVTDGLSLKNSPGAITVASGASFNYGQAFTANNLTNALTLSGTGDGTYGALNLQANAVATGGITLAADATITHDWNNGTIQGGAITGSGRNLQLTTNVAGQPGLAINSAIQTGAGGVSVTGVANGGTYSVLLGGNNTFTGGLTINNGVVQLNHSGALNSTAGSENAVTFGASTTTGKLALNGRSYVISNLTSNATPGTPVVENGNATAVTLTVGNSQNLSGTYAGIIQNGTGGGALALTKTGTGVLTLSGNNTFTGATTIGGGTLALTGLGSFANSSAIIVGNAGSSGAVLDLTAKTAPFAIGAGQLLGGGGTVRLAASGTLNVLGTFSPGNSPGLFTYDGGTTLLSGTTLMEIFGASRATSPSHGTGFYDAVNVINAGTLTFAGPLTLDITGSYADNTIFDLFTASGGGSLAGNVSGITVIGSSIYSGLTFTSGTANPKLWTSTATGGGQSLTFDAAAGTLVIVPEPGAIALAGIGIGVAAWAARRRRGQSERSGPSRSEAGGMAR